MAESVDTTFFHTYKPAMYPLSFNEDDQDWSSPHVCRSRTVQSLVDLACLAVIRNDAIMTRFTTTSIHSSSPPSETHQVNVNSRASQQEELLPAPSRPNVSVERRVTSGLIPVDLCQPLLKAALLSFKDDAVEQILSIWPSKSLVLSDYVEPMFRDVNPLYSDRDLCTEMRRGVKYTTCLAHSFMVCLKRKDPIKLRYLDLTGFPMAEITVSYLASHVLLVSNEERQRRIISRYNQVTRNLYNMGLDVHLRDVTPSTFPDEQPVVVCLDALIQNEDPHLELCRALHASNSEATSAAPRSPLTLRVRRLDTSSLGVVRIIVLMELIQPQYLTAVSLQLNSFVNSELIVLHPAMKSFVNLTSLDLSCNNVHLTGPSSQTASSLAAMFSSLVSLERLDLSSSRLTGCLSMLLCGIIKPLTLLRLHACDLDPTDVAYLSTSHHSTTLSQLDLSVNRLSTSTDSLILLLRNASVSIMTLELAATFVDLNTVVDILSTTGVPVRSLRYLDIRRTPSPTVNDIIRAVPFFIAMRHFDALQLPYPHDIANEDYDAGMLTEVRSAFTVLINKLVRQLHASDARPPLKLLFDKSV